MENHNVNANKRYNQFRQARRKKDKSNTVNMDEVSGRNYKLERFLRDCMLHLPKHKQECEYEIANVEVAKTKPTKPKHVKMPVMNECKGLFESVIIGRTAKKVDDFGEIAATPEDAARLREDIHALAKVGPDSELSFELLNLPSSPKRSFSDRILETVDATENPASPFVPVTDANCENAHGESRPEEHNRSRHSRTPEKEQPYEKASCNQSLFQENQDNSAGNDSGFKDAAGSLQSPPRPSSIHCECCEKTKTKKHQNLQNFFDAEAILKSNEPNELQTWEDPSLGAPSLKAPSLEAPFFSPQSSLGSGMNVIFSKRRDPSWLFEEFPGGLANSLGSTFQSRVEPPFDFQGIEVQSSAPSLQMDFEKFRDVHTGSRQEPYAGQGMLKRRTPWPGFNKEAEVKRYSIHPDRYADRLHSGNLDYFNAYNKFRYDSLNADRLHSGNLDYFNAYNKFRYDRSLSPRKF